MPLRSPGDCVVRDSGAGLWAAMAEGILDEDDITASGRLRPSLDGNLPPPSPTNWAANMQRSTLFGMQQPPFSSPMVTPEVTPQPSPVAPPAPIRPSRVPLAGLRDSDENAKAQVARAHAELKVVKADLCLEDEIKPGQAAREGMLRRFVALAHEVEAMLESDAR